jgi:two-component system sensor histidine kinase/response regulator
MTSGIARLLIVDDEATQLRALCDTLELEGYSTQGFSSGRQALAALRPGDFDLLLTDLMMPEMDGISLLNAAKRVDTALGAIVMTGHGTIDTAVKAMQGGALDYILKPFRLNVILPIISRALDVQRLRRENAELHAREKLKSAELAAAYHDLESFSYSISHDLRAPLRTLDGFAGILESEFSEQLGAEGRRIIGVIRAGSQKMDDLIVSLLEFSRVGRSALELDRVDMTLLAESAAAEVRALHIGPMALIEIADLPAVEADAILIRQWRTTAPASTCVTRTSSSAFFSACTRARIFPEPALDLQLCIASSCAMAAESGRGGHPMAAPASNSRFR